MELQNKKTLISTQGVKSNIGTTKHEPVLAQICEGLNQKFNVRLVTASVGAMKHVNLGCQPRKGATRRDAQPLDLPDTFKDRFTDINKAMTEFLQKSPKNATHFLSNPLEAMQKAGIELSRAEQKHFSRNAAAMKMLQVNESNVHVQAVEIAAAKGKIRKQTEIQSDFMKGMDDDCGCNK